MSSVIVPTEFYKYIIFAGEFATQTCFQGRFGEDIGSDQYGAQIMISSAKPDLGDVQARISHIEVTYAGQAFRLGRYAIHFHLNGHLAGSYVKGCSIHKYATQILSLCNHFHGLLVVVKKNNDTCITAYVYVSTIIFVQSM